MSPDDPSSSAADVVKDAELSPGSHTPPSESPPLPDDEVSEGENHAPDPDSQPEPESEPKPEPEPEPELEPDPAAIAAEAEKLKEEGNDSFKRGRYGDAIDLYSKAIGNQPTFSPIFLVPKHAILPRSRLHRTSVPHEPRSGLHRAQALPPRPRRLPTRRLAPVATLDGRSGAPQNAPAPRAMPARAGPDDGRALDAARRARSSSSGGGGGRAAAPDRAAGDADAVARFGARGARAQFGRGEEEGRVGDGAHRARSVFAGRGGRGERDPDRVASLASRDRARAGELGWCE